MLLKIRAVTMALSILYLMGCVSDTIQSNTAQQSALLNVKLGLGYLEQGERPRAKTKLTHALALAPHLPETCGAMAYFREMVGDIAEANRLHREAIRVAVNKGAVYNNYAAYLCRQGQYAEADVFFQRALKDKTYARTAEVYENAGLCVLKSTSILDSAHYEKAVNYFTQALNHDPNKTQAKQALEQLQQQGREAIPS